jgi:hypothetical protein
MEPVLDKFLVFVMYGISTVATIFVAIFGSATLRAYRNGQISGGRLVGTIVFLVVCVAVPILILFAFYPRPSW